VPDKCEKNTGKQGRCEGGKLNKEEKREGAEDKNGCAANHLKGSKSKTVIKLRTNKALHPTEKKKGSRHRKGATGGKKGKAPRKEKKTRKDEL